MWLFFNDIYPARMAVPNLIDALDKHHIQEFYTYETAYNDALSDTINAEVPGKYKIHYLKSLDDIKTGWVVIQSTNSKSPSMECDPEAIEGDFIRDPKLNKLLATRKIEQLATAKFETFGSSRVWPQEADVATYMDLILKEIDDDARFRGYAWLINVENIDK